MAGNATRRGTSTPAPVGSEARKGDRLYSQAQAWGLHTAIHPAPVGAKERSGELGRSDGASVAPTGLSHTTYDPRLAPACAWGYNLSPLRGYLIAKLIIAVRVFSRNRPLFSEQRPACGVSSPQSSLTLAPMRTDLRPSTAYTREAGSRQGGSAGRRSGGFGRGDSVHRGKCRDATRK